MRVPGGKGPAHAAGRPDDAALASLLREAALSIHGARGDDGLVDRLRAAMVAIDPHAGRRFDLASMLGDWRAGLWQRGGLLQVEADTLGRRIRLLEGGTDARCADSLARARARLPVVEATLARVERLLSLGQDEMEADLLPFGTPVRIRPDSFATEEAVPGPRPVAGAVGVVVGYRSLSDRPLAVAIARTVHDDGGGMLEFRPDAPWTFDVSVADVDVAGPATLVGLGANDAVGYVPTHARADGRDEMLLEACGLVWRVLPTGGLGSALKAAYPDEAALPWLSRIQGPAMPNP